MESEIKFKILESDTIASLVQKNKDRFGDRIAFRDENKEITFANFADRVETLASSLLSKGLAKGDRIALLSRNCIEYMEVACVSGTGAMIATLNWRLSYDELSKLIENCEPKVIIAETSFLERDHWPMDPFDEVPIKIALSGRRKGWINYEDLMRGNSDSLRKSKPKITPKDGACIVYTSGTSGLPKGVIHTNQSLLTNAQHQISLLGLSPQDRTLAIMPFFHVGGMWYHAFPSYASGAETIIRGRFKPQLTLDLIAKYKVSNIHLVPTMVGDLISLEVGEAAKYLKTLFYAASPMPVKLLKKAMVKFPSCGFLQCYGSSEAGSLTCLTPEDHRKVFTQNAKSEILQSCGRPYFKVKLRIQNESADAIQSNQIGEVQASGPGTMTKYWNNKKETDKTIRNNWVATGDLGRMDEEGYLYLVDRKNDMIITGGENVYPGEVEQIIYEFDGVLEACVVGIKDPRFIEKVVACVVMKVGYTKDESAIIDFCKSKLAGYKCPKQIFFHDALPRSGAGKILKRPLREQLYKSM